MDLALHVAPGWDWAGRPTMQGPVVYIAAENVSGMRKRKVGFEMAHDATLPRRTPFYLVEAARTSAWKGTISTRSSHPLRP
jgi:hypothetical protein